MRRTDRQNRTSLHAQISLEPCNVLTLLIHTLSHRVRNTQNLTSWHNAQTLMHVDKLNHAVLAYCRQNCTTSIRTERSLDQKNKTMKYLDVHLQERTKTTLARAMRNYITQQSSHKQVARRTRLPKRCLEKGQMLCPHGNTLRNISCRVFIFQQCSWHWQKSCSKDCSRTQLGPNPNSWHHLVSKCSPFMLVIPPDFTDDICSPSCAC